MSRYRTMPADTEGMPPGIPYIIGNEAAERFSYYGMRTILTIFMVRYLYLMSDTVMPALPPSASDPTSKRSPTGADSTAAPP